MAKKKTQVLLAERRKIISKTTIFMLFRVNKDFSDSKSCFFLSYELYLDNHLKQEQLWLTPD
ncbi:hypothetical protein [uncultured Bacteroides sp.]|uniref:hypothetical protein n=1 Tax=uncultured Bacteroides sp. TaxID=162156 RepID=UPI0025FFCABB|nr:hypothetical protein [uncultured Bacteroides sp.]